MAIADEKAVRGDFNNARFEHDGVVAVFSRRRRRRDGRFFVTSLRPLGRSFGRRPGELPRGHPKALGRPSVEPVLVAASCGGAPLEIIKSYIDNQRRA
jgi:hypothetical protein